MPQQGDRITAVPHDCCIRQKPNGHRLREGLGCTTRSNVHYGYVPIYGDLPCILDVRMLVSTFMDHTWDFVCRIPSG